MSKKGVSTLKKWYKLSKTDGKSTKQEISQELKEVLNNKPVYLVEEYNTLDELDKERVKELLKPIKTVKGQVSFDDELEF